MAVINISDLRPNDSDVLKDSELFMTILSDEELGNIQGGWIGTAIAGAALAYGVYVNEVSADQRSVNRAGIKAGIKGFVKYG